MIKLALDFEINRHGRDLTTRDNDSSIVVNEDLIEDLEDMNNQQIDVMSGNRK